MSDCCRPQAEEPGLPCERREVVVRREPEPPPVDPPPAPMPQGRLRVGVFYNQRQDVPVPNVTLTVGGAPAPVPGGDGFSDFGELPYGLYDVTVAESADVPRSFVTMSPYAQIDLDDDLDYK